MRTFLFLHSFLFGIFRNTVFMFDRIGVNGSDGGFSVVSWGVLVSVVAVLVMVALTLFMGNNLTSMSVTLISGLLVVIAVVMLTQVIKKAFTSL